MSMPAPGWYKDPAEPTTQRYWDGEGWIGDPLPADAEPPPGPPPERTRTGEPQIPPDPAAGPAHPPHAERIPPPAGRPGTRPPNQATPPGWLPQPATAPGDPTRPHGYTLASPGTRLLARLIDAGLLLLLNVVVNGWFALQLWRELAPTLGEAWRQAQTLETPNADTIPPVGDQLANLLFAMLFIAAALWFAYEVPSVANSGQTVGKRLLRIKVVRLESADPLSFGRSLRRWNTMGLPILLWPCFGIGLMLQLVDAMFVPFDRPLHQALHDKSAHTAVVTVDSHKETPHESAHPS